MPFRHGSSPFGSMPCLQARRSIVGRSSASSIPSVRSLRALVREPFCTSKRAAEEERLLDVLDRERALATVGPVLGAHQRVGHEVREAIPATSRGSLGRDLAVDVGDHLVDVRAQTMDLRELRLRHVGDGHVDVASVLGERRRHLGADEDVALPGVEQLADAVDRVVIRQGDERHAALLEEPVDLHGIGVGLGQRERVRRVVVRHVRGIRMEVEVHLAPERSFHRLLSFDRDPRDRLRALSSVLWLLTRTPISSAREYEADVRR